MSASIVRMRDDEPVQVPDATEASAGLRAPLAPTGEKLIQGNLPAGELIKDYVLRLKEPGETSHVILSPAELRRLLEADNVAGRFSDDEIMSAVGYLSDNGDVSILKTPPGEPRILLAPDFLNDVASSIVREAQWNTEGLRFLDERRVLAGAYSFPMLAELRAEERQVLLYSAVAMLLQHNICFREVDPLNATIRLVFPAQIDLKRPGGEEQPVEDEPSYEVRGTIENTAT
jgi:hypothetical protein